MFLSDLANVMADARAPAPRGHALHRTEMPLLLTTDGGAQTVVEAGSGKTENGRATNITLRDLLLKAKGHQDRHMPIPIQVRDAVEQRKHAISAALWKRGAIVSSALGAQTEERAEHRPTLDLAGVQASLTEAGIPVALRDAAALMDLAGAKHDELIPVGQLTKALALPPPPSKSDRPKSRELQKKELQVRQGLCQTGCFIVGLFMAPRAQCWSKRKIEDWLSMDDEEPPCCGFLQLLLRAGHVR